MLVDTNVVDSSRLPLHDTVVAHGARHVLELNLLLHTPGFGIKTFQDRVEMINRVKLQDLSCAIPLHVREEQLPSLGVPQSLAYPVDRSVVGSLLIQDPAKACKLAYEGPHIQSFVTSDPPFGCLAVSVEDGTVITSSKVGIMVSAARKSFSILDDTKMVGLCRCGDHFKVLKPVAFISLTSSMLVWKDSAPNKSGAIAWLLGIGPLVP